ncbi:hypothetical protein [Tsukamurella pseudospumae]|uniref:Uncharacterized protein n=1 Tax=Tsukamurella pseudospumae TaxID=239498 RepID=A0A137ZHX1_9ACTN|nr:hypothetical protein [Tsukamurella pseudospumae]KXO97757.1 hypothetical protein AXK61_21280 [Tsukamurella pseudospumae]
MTITYRGRDALVDVDPEAGTATVTPTRTGTSWTVGLREIEAVGVRCSTLLKRGRGDTEVAGARAGVEVAHDSSPNSVTQLHAVPRGEDEDSIAIAAAPGGVGIPTVTLDGKDRPMKVGKLSMWGGGLD